MHLIQNSNCHSTLKSFEARTSKVVDTLRYVQLVRGHSKTGETSESSEPSKASEPSESSKPEKLRDGSTTTTVILLL